MIALISRAPVGRKVPADTGTADRLIRRGLTERGALRAAKRYAEGRSAYRVEFFHDGRFYGAPFCVLSFGY